MGNCIMHESQVQWGGEDWEPAMAPAYSEKEDTDDGVVGGKGGASNPKPTVSTEVKVKITKKQLKELVGNTDLQGSTVQEVLAQLMKASARYETYQRASWRPRLQSIPEVNSFGSSG